MSAMSSATALLHDHRIVVCVGTGGVGKTTIAAALALLAARQGLRTLVLTIDPARRLADALGIAELGNEPMPVAASDDRAPFELHAMMLDPRRTFDGLVERFASSEAALRQILDNPIYQHASGALSGSGEYAAMEKVLEISESGNYDLVVVDTPPAQHVLDFLDAPSRLVEFLDSRLVKLLVHPAIAAGRLGVRLFQRPIQVVLQLLERVTGVGFLEDLSAFLMAIDDMSDGFKERANRIERTLLGDETAFLLIAGSARESSQHAEMFLTHLDAMRARLRGIVINRIHAWPDKQPPRDALIDQTPPEADVSKLAELLGDRDAAQAAIAATRAYARQAARDVDNTRVLAQRARDQQCLFCMIPEQPQDVHDLASLERIATALRQETHALANP